MLTDLEFEKRISLIDKEQRDENIPIFKRSLDAINRYTMKYSVVIMMGGRGTFSSKDKYSSSNIAHTISDWYDNKYGDKVKTDLSKGYVALLIAGSVYKMKIPLIFGKALAYADGKFNLHPSGDKDGTMFLNIISFIEDLTKELSSELSNEEENNILQVFDFASQLFELMSKGPNKNNLCQSAKEDFNYSVDSILNSHLNVGHSKWASLQATEKILKSILQRKKISFKKTHNIRELISMLCNIGYPKVSDNIINTIQCDAGVRYGNIPYNIEDAIKAHHYSIYLCKEYLKISV